MKKTVIFFIKLYKKYISPYKGTKCPYYPSCSDYGIEAFSKYGIIIGGSMTLFRIFRCNPFSKGGVDPVPDIGEDYYILIRRKV